MAEREAELMAAFSAHQPQLRAWLIRLFPRLGDEVDDLLQEVVTETLRRLRREGFCPERGWGVYWRWLARRRACDRLRTWERQMFQRLGSGVWADDADSSSKGEGDALESIDPRPGPDKPLLEAERRGRQGLMLSEVLEEFCRWCESRPERSRIKEAYERSLRGQQPAEIAAGLGISADEVYLLLNRARTWVLERVRQSDVDRSVFLTLHRRKKE